MLLVRVADLANATWDDRTPSLLYDVRCFVRREP
jgi:hypothetical protein